MPLIVLPGGWTVALCFLAWLVFHTVPALICLRLPDRFFAPDRRLYRTRYFEKDGRIYDRLFRVSRWKHLLPDGGALWNRSGFRKKKLESLSPEYLERFLTEASRGELTHWLTMLSVWTFWLFTPPPIPWIMLAYALAVNIPCILAQRYNRPRIRRLLKKLRQRPAVGPANGPEVQ